ncbi:MAG TPA: hypothetical protein PLF26_10700 [Blastocatellia bacterium]|nr:hypothetical protein [Blastocatellia bacterium]
MAKLGQEVDVYCGRCKVERYHTVAAVSDDGKIERVQCGYCHSSRKYRDPAATPRSRKAAAARESEPAAPGRPYTTRHRFDKGDVLEHNKYGRGRVTEVRGDRIDVRFGDGELRTFLHGMS